VRALLRDRPYLIRNQDAFRLVPDRPDAVLDRATANEPAALPLRCHRWPLAPATGAVRGAGRPRG
jgi:hypothetical protein